MTAVVVKVSNIASSGVNLENFQSWCETTVATMCLLEQVVTVADMSPTQVIWIPMGYIMDPLCYALSGDKDVTGDVSIHLVASVLTPTLAKKDDSAIAEVALFNSTSLDKKRNDDSWKPRHGAFGAFKAKVALEEKTANSSNGSSGAK